MVFFAYSALIGVFAVVLSLAVQRRQQAQPQEPGARQPASRRNP
jgi:hypothetical protein